MVGCHPTMKETQQTSTLSNLGASSADRLIPMIPCHKMMGIEQELSENAMSEEGFIEMPLYLVYLPDSLADKQREGPMMPAGSFEYEGRY